MNALLRQFKDQYENVFAANFKDQQFIFRELTRKEYRRIVDETFGDTYTYEETICQTAVLYPEDYDFSVRGRAGLAKTLAVEIVETSGFGHPDQQIQMLNYFRSDMQNFDSQAETVIQLVFPNISEDEMQDWTQEKLMRRLARAEWVMKEIWQMPFEFAKRDEVDPNAPPPEPPSIMEVAQSIRDQGGDPMFVLKDQIMSPRDKDYVAFPLIGGTKLFKNEEVLENVRKQIQGIPER